MTSRRLLGRAGAVLSCAFAIAAIAGPVVAPYADGALDVDAELRAPSRAHPLGTGENGVDLLAAILHGARRAGIIALWVVGGGLVAGTAIGASAGYFGGLWDAAIVAAVDLVLAFPSILLAMAFVALVGRPGTMHLVVALGLSSWVPYARLARAQTLTLREREFVVAARALGASDARILLRHIVPNLAGPLVVQATFAAGATVLAESSLSFLGLGGNGGASWGALLDQGAGYLLTTPRAAAVPGLAIALTVFGFNLFGDVLRERLDPLESARSEG